MENRDQVEGEIKEQTGKLADDESKENEGRARAWGDAKEKAGDVEDEVRDRLSGLRRPPHLPRKRARRPFLDGESA